MGDEPLIKIDFLNTFPGKYWMSNWSKDEKYPNGYRYKLLSSINHQKDIAELVVVIEERDRSKTEMARMDVALSSLNRIAATFTNRLSDSYALDFDFQDYSTITTAEEFEKLIFQAGWHEYN